LKGEAAAAAALRSQLEQQLDEMQSMQDHIGQKQREAEGAAERELEMELELTEAAKLQQQYNQLLQQYAYTHAQLEDIKSQLSELKTRNQLLQQIAGKVGEIESHLANTVMERDGLMTRITLLENAKFRHEI
jgi:DNA repair exonuclease SbcCD ATPase subunit